MHFDLFEIIKTVGLFGVAAIVFAESGLLIGFFLPGDSLLFTAGFLASQGFFNIYVLAGVCFVAAVVGDSVGYSFGKKMGPKLFTKEDSIWFHKKNLAKAQHFYEQHGRKTIILSRFLPVVRTFAPIVAGIGNMEYRTFLMFNVIGGFLWAVGLTVAGYLLGNIIPADKVDKYLLPIILGIIFLSIAPTALHILKDQEQRESIIAFVKKMLGMKTPKIDENPEEMK
jgi:membrane-associated protein